MRKVLWKITAVLLFCLMLTTPVYATQKITLSQHKMALYLSDDFTVVTAQNAASHKETLEAFDTTVTQTQIKIEKENYLILGISQSMHCTVFLSCVEDRVSASIGDLITYENGETAKQLLLGSSLPKEMEVREWEQRGALFYRVNFGVQKGVGRIAYITVMNGKCYTLCLVDNVGTLNDNMNALIDTVFETWEYTIDAEAEKIQEFRDTVTTVFYWITLPIGIAVCGLIVRYMIRDVRQKEQQRKRKENTPKKPRR